MMLKLLQDGLKLIPVILAFAHLHFAYCKRLQRDGEDAVVLAPVTRSRNDDEVPNPLSEMCYVGHVDKACSAKTRTEDIEGFQITKKTSVRIMKNLNEHSKSEKPLKAQRIIVTLKLLHNVRPHRQDLEQANTGQSGEKFYSWRSDDDNVTETENLLNILRTMARDADIKIKCGTQSKASSISINLMCVSKSEDDNSCFVDHKVTESVLEKNSALPPISQNSHNESRSGCYDGNGNDKGNGNSKSQQSSSQGTQNAVTQSNTLSTSFGNGAASGTGNTQDGNGEDDRSYRESIPSGYCQTSVSNTTESIDTVNRYNQDPNQPVDDGNLERREGPVLNTEPLSNPEEGNEETLEQNDDSPGVQLLQPREGGPLASNFDAAANENPIFRQGSLLVRPYDNQHIISGIEKHQQKSGGIVPYLPRSEELNADYSLNETNECRIQPPTVSDPGSGNQSFVPPGDGNANALVANTGTDHTTALLDTGQPSTALVGSDIPAPNTQIDSSTLEDGLREERWPADVLDDLLNRLHGDDANEVVEINLHPGQPIQVEVQQHGHNAAADREVDVQTRLPVQTNNGNQHIRTFWHPEGSYGRTIQRCRECFTPHLVQRFHEGLCPDCSRFHCLDCTERHNCLRVFCHGTERPNRVFEHPPNSYGRRQWFCFSCDGLFLTCWILWYYCVDCGRQFCHECMDGHICHRRWFEDDEE